MGLGAKLLLGHCSPCSGRLRQSPRIEPTDRLQGIRASLEMGQARAEVDRDTSSQSWKSRRDTVGIPMLPALDHAVEDDQELPNTCGEDVFLGFAGNQHPLVKRVGHWVVSAGDQRSHVDDHGHSCSATPDNAAPAHGSAVPVDGSNADQSGDLFAVQHAQFRRVRQERQRELLSHAVDRAQQIVLLPLHRTAAQRLSQTVCPASTRFAELPSISFAGSPPLTGPTVGRHQSGSWGRQTRG